MSAITSARPATVTNARRSTQGTLVRLFAAIAVLSIIALATALVVAARIHEAARTIGVDTKPSIVAAEKIATSLAAIDADVANEALLGRTIAQSKEYLADAEALNTSLVEAARNITYADTETRAVLGMQNGLHTYYEMLGEARSRAALDSAQATRKVEAASQFLRANVFPSAQALATANLDPLADAYKSYMSGSVTLGLVEIAVSVALLGAMMWAQLYLSLYSKRTLNWPMATASVILVCAVGWFSEAVFQERADIKVAKQDAFDSIHPLYRAKAALYAINADESLWLVDPGETRSALQDDFVKGARSILDIDGTNGSETTKLGGALSAALTAEKAGDPQRASRSMPVLKGYLGDELGNITFGVAERTPATQAVTSFIDYLRIDREIRDTESRGDHKAAIALDIGTKEGQSDWAFDQTDKAIDATIAINDEVFATRTQAALSNVAEMSPVIIAALCLTLALSGFGLYQRFKEFP